MVIVCLCKRMSWFKEMFGILLVVRGHEMQGVCSVCERDGGQLDTAQVGKC